MTTRVHIINAGPDRVVIETIPIQPYGATPTKRELIPGEHAELYVHAGQRLQIDEVPRAQS